MQEHLKRQRARSFPICILFQHCSIVYILVLAVVITISELVVTSPWTLNRLLSTHRWWDTSVDHCIFKALEGCTFLDLRFLQFAKKLVLHLFEIHALLFKCTYLISHFGSFYVNFSSCICSLLLDEIVLLLQTLRLSLTDLLLAELSIIVVLFTHSVQIMFHMILLSSDFFNCCKLLVSEIFVSEEYLLLFLLFSLGHGLSFHFEPLLSLLLVPLLLQDSIVILILQFLQLSRLLLRLLDLLDGPHFLVLQHANAIAQQFHIPLQLQANGSSLIESQVFTLDVDDDVGADLAIGNVLALRSLAHHSTLAAFGQAHGVAALRVWLANRP